MINLESNCEVMKYHCNDTNTPKKLKYREFDMTSKTQKRKFIFWVWNMSFVLIQSRHTLSDFTFNFHFHALEKATATHSSVLAWRIPGTGEPGGLPSVGSHRGDLAAAAAGISLGLPIWLSGKESTCQCRRSRRRGFDPWVRKIPWKRSWQPTPVFLLWKSHGQRSLVGYGQWGHKESNTIQQLSMHTCISLPGQWCSFRWLGFIVLQQHSSLHPHRDCHQPEHPSRFIHIFLSISPHSVAGCHSSGDSCGILCVFLFNFILDLAHCFQILQLAK